jgi:hypothetical protein
MSRLLTQRLQALADRYKQTLDLIQELRTFSPSASTADDPVERRLELANDIHESLKEQEDTLDILKQEVDDGAIPSHRRDPTALRRSDREIEREKQADLVTRLSEDYKSARAKFRQAQLQAKRTADAERRKEREQLFTKRRVDNGNSSGGPKQEMLTQDELALRSADDVTQALRRVHQQLEGELAQSQFAQQTLHESQEALKDLADSYSGTTDLLKTSRGLVGQLVRSNKSDSWYLTSAWYLLVITLAWLFFRRILYGPLLLFVWYPVRLMWWTVMTTLGAIGLGRPEKAVELAKPPAPSIRIEMPGVNTNGLPMYRSGVQHRSMELPAKGGGWSHPPPQENPRDPESMLEKVGRIVDGESGNNVDETSEEEQKAAEEQPRNTKKRMMEVEHPRDEL